MDKFKIGDKVNFVVERSLLSGVITKFYKNTYNEEECSIKTEIKTFPHILLQRVSKINDEDDLIKKIADLEAKLDETKKALNTISAKYEKKSKQIFEAIKRQEECSDAYDLLSKENEQLKHQLAEKEKEIEELKKEIRDELVDNDMAILELQQSQNQTAIEELEKVKEFIIKNNEPTKKMTNITRFINQQINDLRGE